MQVRAALRGAARLTAAVRVCWDLDNTLVDSGALLRDGRSLEEAVAIASPLPGMLELVAATRAQLPDAEHVVLSARERALRPPTTAWLREHEAGLAGGVVLLVPRAEHKPRVWDRLAAGGSLMIVDDLTHGHERPRVEPYTELVAHARRVAAVYLGADDIAAAGADPGTAAALAGRAADALGGRPLDT